MVLPTTATEDYDVTPYGSTITYLEAAIDPSVAPIDLGALLILSSTVTADSTTTSGGKARRVTAFSLTQPAFYATSANGPTDVAGRLPFQLSVYSTSDEDAAGEVGVRTIDVDYNDDAGNPQTESGIVLTGKTPVLSGNINYNSVTAVRFASTGTWTTSKGVLIFECVPLTGSSQPSPRTVGTQLIIGSVLEGLFNNIPPTNTNELKRAFQNMLTVELTSLVGPLYTNPVTIT